MAIGREYTDGLGLGYVPSPGSLMVKLKIWEMLFPEEKKVAVTRIKTICARQAETIDVCGFHVAFLKFWIILYSVDYVLSYL